MMEHLLLGLYGVDAPGLKLLMCSFIKRWNQLSSSSSSSINPWRSFNCRWFHVVCHLCCGFLIVCHLCSWSRWTSHGLCDGFVVVGNFSYHLLVSHSLAIFHITRYFTSIIVAVNWGVAWRSRPHIGLDQRSYSMLGPVGWVIVTVCRQVNHLIM